MILNSTTEICRHPPAMASRESDFFRIFRREDRPSRCGLCFCVPNLRDSAGKFLRVQIHGNGAADLFRPGKIPKIGEILALPGLDRLHRAIISVQKNAFVIGFFLQRQPLAILPQPSETLDEFVFAEALEGGQPRDFRVGQTHLSRPAAAGRATLTFQKNRHARR